MSVVAVEHGYDVVRVQESRSGRYYSVIADRDSSCYYIDGINVFFSDKESAIAYATTLLESAEPPIQLVKHAN